MSRPGKTVQVFWEACKVLGPLVTRDRPLSSHLRSALENLQRGIVAALAADAKARARVKQQSK
jgi:hypothetical protein